MVKPIDNLFLSIGAMKAGTTWLYAMIKDHPEIHVTPEKEIHYFAELFSDYNPLTRGYRYKRFLTYAGRIDPEKAPLISFHPRLAWYLDFLLNIEPRWWYAKLFEGRKTNAYCADFSNLSVFMSDDGWAHARTLARKKLRVLYTLRDPLERTWSHMRFHAQQSGLNLDFQTMSESDLQDYAAQDHFWENSAYSGHIERLKRNLSEEELMIAIYEDWHADRAASLTQLENFLGIENMDYPEDTLISKVNPSPKAVMPEALKAYFAPKIEAEYKALETLGLSIPKTWSGPS